MPLKRGQKPSAETRSKRQRTDLGNSSLPAEPEFQSRGTQSNCQSQTAIYYGPYRSNYICRRRTVDRLLVHVWTLFDVIYVTIG